MITYYDVFSFFAHVLSSDHSTTYIHTNPLSEGPNITGNVMLLPSFGLRMSAPANSAEVLNGTKDDFSLSLFRIYGRWGCCTKRARSVVHCWILLVYQNWRPRKQSHTEKKCCCEICEAKQMIHSITFSDQLQQLELKGALGVLVLFMYGVSSHLQTKKKHFQLKFRGP